MGSQFQSNYDRKFKQQQSLYNKSEIEEIYHQLSERQADRSRQRYLFEQQSNKLQQSHHCDQEIQENSIQDGTNNTMLELKQHISFAEDIIFQEKLSPELNNDPNINQNMNETISEAQINNVDEQQRQLKQHQTFENTIICNQLMEQQQISNVLPSDIKSFMIQDQNNIFASQDSHNTEKISQVAKNDIQPNRKRKNVFNNEIWLQDDIFYKSNLQKLGTKVASVFKKQYQIHQDQNQKHIIKLIKQIISVMAAAHIAAIGWYFLGIQEINSNQSSWLSKVGIQNNAYYEKYVYAIYWSITTMTTEVLVNPNEVIICEQEQDDQSIYFVQSGIIEIYQQKIQKENKVNIIKVLRDGQVFGELSFFSGLQRQSSARSVNLSTLYKIRRDIFIEILKDNVEDFERFKMIQDQIVFSNELSSVHIECYNCKNVGHLVIQCPKIHLIKDQQLIILKQNYSNFQERAQFERKRTKLITKTKNKFSKNGVICNLLKFNLKQQNDQRYLLFNTYEELFSSEDYTGSLSQSEEDEGESLSQAQSNFDEQFSDANSKIQNKAYTRKKTDYISKSLKKIINNSQQNIEESQCQLSQDKISENNKCSSNQENQEFKRAVSNIPASDVKIQSLDKLDNFNNSNPNLHFRQKQLFSQQCNTILKKDQDNLSQNSQEINEEKKGSVLISFKILDKLNSEIHNQLDQEQLKYIKSLQDQILQQNSIFYSLIFEKRIPQFQDLTLKNKNQDPLDSFFNQNNQDIRKVSVKNDNQEKKNSLMRFIRDLKERRLSQSCQNINQLKNQNIRDKQNVLILNQQQQQQDRGSTQNYNLQFINKISSNLQDSQIPLILQLSNYKSFLNMENEVSSIISNQFDRIYHFKKYFPHHNFLKVNQKLKKYQIEQKKLKRNHQGLKQRRLGLSRNISTSIFQREFNIIRFFPQNYNINLYKPTYLSYGVKMQKGNTFPKNFNSLEKN
ncbi:hypothetical protein ABPG72_009340 [Tetrahymena utriculariae]